MNEFINEDLSETIIKWIEEIPEKLKKEKEAREYFFDLKTILLLKMKTSQNKIEVLR